MLEIEKLVQDDTLNQDCLAIFARGIGWERILVSLLRIYCDPELLVLVINTTQRDESYFIEQLKDKDVAPIPKLITNEIPAAERKNVYLEGGVQFVTSRILVVDLLQNRIPVELVTGIIICHAHQIVNSFQEAFILRLFRQNNSTGFITAFSDQPTAFTRGFCQMQRPQVQEIEVRLTPCMQIIQASLLSIITTCLKEIKQSLPQDVKLETDMLSPDDALGPSFDAFVRNFFDPIWNQLGRKIQQLINEVKVVKTLFQFLELYDACSFYHYVENFKNNERAIEENSGWVYTEAAEKLFEAAKRRVFNETDAGREIRIEPIAKWTALRSVVEEAVEYWLANNSNESFTKSNATGNVLIIASDEKVCKDINEYLLCGGHYMLNRHYERSFPAAKLQPEEVQMDPPVVGIQPQLIGIEEDTDLLEAVKKRQMAMLKDRKQRKRKPVEMESVTLTQIFRRKKDDPSIASTSNDGADSPRADSQTTESSVDDVEQAEVAVMQAFIQPLSSGHYALLRSLEKLRPLFVVLYNPDMAVIRYLEAHKASHPGMPMKVYFMFYKDSTEEQRYLQSVKRETEAFKFLAKEHSNLLFPKQYDVSRDLADVADGASSSRQAGGQDRTDRQQKQSRKVVVDLREFRSELPSLIHRANIDIVPVTLEVGDYVLTPEVCVERKSVSDLIGSLGSGRLYAQVKAMCGVYAKPLLLIEFDPEKPFQGGRAGVSNELRSADVASKLALLTLHFPQLRILWSQSPHHTTEIFDDLKFSKPEPDVLMAQAMTADRDESDSEDSLASGNGASDSPNNRNYAEMLQKLPGINAKNSHSIARRVKNMKELCSKTFAELQQLLGNDSAALKLHNLLNETCRAEVGPAADGKNSDAADPHQNRKKAYRRNKR